MEKYYIRWGRQEQAKTVFEELVQKNQDPILDGWMLQRFALAEGSHGFPISDHQNKVQVMRKKTQTTS